MTTVSRFHCPSSPLALKKLGYDHNQIQTIVDFINENDTIEGCEELKDEHLPIFDCAFKPVKGERSINYMGHIRMMSAVQPYLSGAILRRSTCRASRRSRRSSRPTSRPGVWG